MSQLQADTVRINTRISAEANAWLDKRSKARGISKSTLVLLAIENYIEQKDAMVAMADMGSLAVKLEEIERKLSK